MLAEHPLLVQRDGSNRLRYQGSSLIITKEMGYCHNSSGERGNSIDFLVRHMGMDIKDAVHTLCGFAGWQYGGIVPPRPYKPQERPATTPTAPDTPFILPPRETGS